MFEEEVIWSKMSSRWHVGIQSSILVEVLADMVHSGDIVRPCIAMTCAVEFHITDCANQLCRKRVGCEMGYAVGNPFLVVFWVESIPTAVEGVFAGKIVPILVIKRHCEVLVKIR
jgi:hypothetical protein